jgi:CO dehydrogenase/acetyl-CoA synthase gamma subunit (corrinoid Fe-S protein)
MSDLSQPTSQASFSIAVSAWAPDPYDKPGAGPDLVRIHVEESFTGDLTGDGVATMLQVLRSDGSATFCALERVTGSLAGRTGTFVFQDTGALATDGQVEGTWFVVPGSGTGELSGLRGEGGFTAVLGQHASATLTYWFEG